MIKFSLDKVLKKQKKSVYWLSKQTGISQNNLGKIVKNESAGINFDTLEKICVALDCDIPDILKYIPNNNKNELQQVNDITESNKEVNELERLNKLINASVDFPQYLSNFKKQINKAWYQILSPDNIQSYTKEEKDEIEKALIICIKNQLLSDDELYNLMISIYNSDNVNKTNL